MKKYTFVFFLSTILLCACNNSSEIDASDQPYFNESGCIPPVTTFAFPASARHSEMNDKIVLPLPPWEAVIQIPEATSTDHLDLILFTRSINGHNEIWVKRQHYYKNEKGEEIPILQLFIYRHDINEWKLIPEELNNSNAKSGMLFLVKNGLVWADFTFSDPPSSYFAIYNDGEERFQYVEGSENVPSTGVRLLSNDGKIWIIDSSTDAIYSFDTVSHQINRKTVLPNLESHSSLFSSMSAIAPDGSIYIMNTTGEYQAELMHYSPKTGKLDYLSNFDLYLGGISLNLFVDHSNRLWVGDLGWMEPSGVWYRIVRSPIFITDRSETGFQFVWGNPSIVLESSNGILWFHSENGMAWLDTTKEKWCWFTTEESNIVEDQQHNLWMIADEKLYKYPQK